MEQAPNSGPMERAAATGGGGHLRGIVMMMATMACFATMDMAAKFLTADYPVPQVVWARYVFHILVMVVVLAPRRRLSFRTGRFKLQIVRSLLLLVATTLFFNGLFYLTLAEASTLSFLAPILMTALSVPILREKVGPRRWAAVVVGFLGVLVVLRPGLGVMHPAAFLILGMALCFAFYQIATRLLSTTEAPLTTLLYTAITGAVIMSAVVPFYWVTPTPGAWALMAFIGLCGGLGHFLLIRASDHAPVSVLAPFIYSQIIWATAWGYIVFGDFPDLGTITGAVIIAGSGIYIVYRESLRRRT